MNKAIKINAQDNVFVALESISAKSKLQEIIIKEDISLGHKFAASDINQGESVIKYGVSIGKAACNIKRGEWVHVHNLKTNLKEKKAYSFEKKINSTHSEAEKSFMGFLRSDGRAGIRNEIWVIPTVGCVNRICEQLCRENQSIISGSLEGVFAFTHPYGCSQMGEDHARTKKLLCSLARHPNAAAVLVVSLGCENLTIDEFKQELGSFDNNRIKFLCCQSSKNEVEDGSKMLAQLAVFAKSFVRQPIVVSKLIVGMKCGGSDGLSGVTANPTVGVFTDKLTASNGTAILTEVPEMFGAEEMLLTRCRNKEVFEKAVNMIEGFKQYYINHGQVVYENPSPGNKQGGITTLEDKSCGCVQKGGGAEITDVLSYAQEARMHGLNLLSGPGNDIVSATALTAAGAHLILFTTGRGTPFGAPAPTIKISSNTELFNKKTNWMDFDAGTVANGERVEAAGERLFQFVLEIANGKKTKAEKNDYREIAIFKDGVTL